MPPDLRAAFDHELALALARIAARAIEARYRRLARRAGLRAPRSGSVCVLQRFSSDLRLNLHLHCLHLDSAHGEDEHGRRRFFTALRRARQSSEAPAPRGRAIGQPPRRDDEAGSRPSAVAGGRATVVLVHARWTALALSWALAACEPSVPASDAGALADAAAPADAGRCATDDECDDGSYCDGLERCAPGRPGADARGCVAGVSPCGEGRSCDEELDRCVCPDADLDHDGHASLACGGDDCDDADAERYPGAVEICDPRGVDEDCDPSTYGYRDADGDGWGDRECCNGSSCGRDCDDTDASRSPTEAEVCNGRDDDCDGEIDEGVRRAWIVDADRDGHGDARAGAATLVACTRPDGWAPHADDCDDGDAAVHPGAIERCDGARDDDCDGEVDPPGLCACTEGESLSCFEPGRCSAGTIVCVGGTFSACSIAPLDEVCNGDDDDCDGLVDEGVRTRCFVDGDGDGLAPLGAEEVELCGACPPGRTSAVPTSDAFDCDDRDAARPGVTPCG